MDTSLPPLWWTNSLLTLFFGQVWSDSAESGWSQFSGLDTYYKGEKTRLKQGEAGFKPFTEEEQAGLPKLGKTRLKPGKPWRDAQRVLAYKQGDANKTTQNANSAKTRILPKTPIP